MSQVLERLASIQGGSISQVAAKQDAESGEETVRNNGVTKSKVCHKIDSFCVINGYFPCYFGSIDITAKQPM